MPSLSPTRPSISQLLSKCFCHHCTAAVGSLHHTIFATRKRVQRYSRNQRLDLLLCSTGRAKKVIRCTALYCNRWQTRDHFFAGCSARLCRLTLCTYVTCRVLGEFDHGTCSLSHSSYWSAHQPEHPYRTPFTPEISRNSIALPTANFASGEHPLYLALRPCFQEHLHALSHLLSVPVRSGVSCGE